MKTDKGAQSAFQSNTDATRQAEREALLFPEAARCKRAVRRHLLPKHDSKQPAETVGKRGRKESGRKARTVGVSLMPDMIAAIKTKLEQLQPQRRYGSFSHYFQHLVALDLAHAEAEPQLGSQPTGAPAVAVANRSIEQERFNPEIASLIRDYQAANPCARERAIEGLLTRMLMHQPATDRKVTPPRLQPAEIPHPTGSPPAASPMNLPITLSQARELLGNIAPTAFCRRVESGKIRKIANNRYSLADVLKLAGHRLIPHP